MSVKAKLYALISSVLVTLLITGLIIFALRSPLTAITEEEEVINELQDQLNELDSVLINFAFQPFRKQTVVWNETKDQVRDAFGGLKTLKVLPSLNDEIGNILKNSQALLIIIESKITSIDRDLASVQTQTAKVFSSSTEFSVMEMFLQSTNHKDNSDYAVLMFNIRTLMTNIEIASDAIDASINTFDKQHMIIIDKVNSVVNRANWIAVIIVLIGALASLFISSLMANHLVKSIHTLGFSLNEIAKGDFTLNVKVNAKGEFLELAQNMNDLQGKFRTSLGKIKDVSTSNIEVKTDLLTLAEETSTASVQISANAESIKKQVSNLSQEMSNTKESTHTIQKRVGELNDQIHDQIAMVEESSSAINQMISSIKTVSEQTATNSSTADELVKVTTAGGEKLQNTMNNIGQVANFVTEIKKMVSIINGISAQTNLLAMNAAIEAAHAGDAGRGFSVVADEIRKLAEAAGKNSKEIGSSLKGITDAIMQAEEAGHITQDSFKEIESRIGQVTDSFKQIDLSMSELSSGSSEILVSMNSLSQISHSVRQGASDINDNTGNVNSVIDKTASVTMEVVGAIQEISGGIDEISSSVQHINTISQRMGDLSDELDREVRVFKTDMDVIEETTSDEDVPVDTEVAFEEE
ncbi:methyl-accepting chemotaxis protein [Spirochaeta cellobiosiphila]|uniref:methyl-accepting chemotaxis protein n=1 Tax=Spirochaeta cellobiosiphila TaxID=504483 RepID=UPI00041546DC|nr:methyl-accepting chemotaxis protein [Spirochaeta cellobiosiphila]